MATLAEVERVRRYYDKIAGEYDTYLGYYERLLLDDGRQWACGQASGDVLEIAVGTGRNLPFYPSQVQLTGIDLNPAMLAVARRRATELGRDVALRLDDAQALDLPDASFDTVVATLALSSIPDDRRAVAEVRRVLRPGGRFLVVEHVRSPRWPVRMIQRVLDPLSVRHHVNHLLRDPLDHLAAEGFIIECVERSKWGIIERASGRTPEPSQRTAGRVRPPGSPPAKGESQLP